MTKACQNKRCGHEIGDKESAYRLANGKRVCESCASSMKPSAPQKPVFRDPRSFGRGLNAYQQANRG